MASTSSKTRPLSFAIVYGFMGGPLHSRRLRIILKEAGYVEAPLREADIVIAHSGATYFLDPGLKPKLLLLVAPALTRKNPHKLFRENTRQLWRSAWEEHYRRKRFLWSLYGFYCFLRDPRRNYKMIRFAYDTKLEPPKFKAVNVFFIANKNDAWPNGPQLAKLLTDRHWAFVSLPGAHEHIWVHPRDYVDIINSYAKRLLG